MTDYLLNGAVIEGAVAYCVDIMGPVFYGMLAFVLFIPLMVRPQYIEFTAAAYILVGYVIQDYMPGEVLATGQILMVIGIAAIIYRLVRGA